MEVAPPNTPTETGGGYQIIIRGILDEETKKRIQDTIKKHQLSYQIGSMWKTKRTINKDADTLIIYKYKKQAFTVTK